MTVDYISSTSLLLRLLIGIGSVHFVASAMILHVSPSAGDSPCSLEAPCNIAWALDVVANSGDTILLSPGVYTPPLRIRFPVSLQASFGQVLRKAVTLVGGLSIDCSRNSTKLGNRIALIGLSFEQQGIVLTSRNFCAAGILFSSFVGLRTGRAAVFVEDSSDFENRQFLQISDTLFLDNESTNRYAGGLVLQGRTSADIGLSIFERNRNLSARGALGGAIFARGPVNLAMRQTRVFDNVVMAPLSSGAGGGIFFHGNTLSMTNCSVQNNYASGGGGGMWLAASSGGVLQSVAVDYNAADGTDTRSTQGSGGGGILFFLSPSMVMRECAFRHNVAARHGGGGVSLINGAPLNVAIFSSVFVNNTSQFGGGISSRSIPGNSALVAGSTFCANVPEDYFCEADFSSLGSIVVSGRPSSSSDSCSGPCACSQDRACSAPVSTVADEWAIPPPQYLCPENGVVVFGAGNTTVFGSVVYCPSVRVIIQCGTSVTFTGTVLFENGAGVILNANEACEASIVATGVYGAIATSINGSDPCKPEVAPMVAFTISTSSLSAVVTLSCSSDLAPGVIVGIALGAILFGVLIALLVWRLLVWQKARHALEFKASALQRMQDDARRENANDL